MEVNLNNIIFAIVVVITLFSGLLWTPKILSGVFGKSDVSLFAISIWAISWTILIFMLFIK